MCSIGDIKILSPKMLRNWLRDGKSSEGRRFAIVDVRDDDYVGGHIKGCFHFPAYNFRVTLPELLDKLEDHQVSDVVFHCALSQARGPKSALAFLRYLKQSEENGTVHSPIMNVWLLKGGFTKWQELYGDDSSVTEDYQKDLWQFGM